MIKMDTENLTYEYKNFLLGLKEMPLNEFLKEFTNLEGYDKREDFLNKCYSTDIFNILIKNNFQKIFYLTPQAEFILKELNLRDLKILETLVYCYNSNSREFNKRIEENNLKEELLKRGFMEQNVLMIEDLKPLHDKKVLCVFDRDKVGLMGSFTSKEEKEGTLKFIEDKNCLAFLPKRHTKTGQFLYTKFYYKLI